MAVSDQWIVLELGPKAEGEDPDLVRASIRHSIRDAEVFIPASVTQMGEERVVQYLVEGYAFIRRKHPDQTYMRLENTKYVQTVLRHPITLNGGRPVKQMAIVSEEEIDRFRKQIRVEVDQGIDVGDLVMITSGPYRQITARVEEEIKEHDAVQVHIKLRSKEAIITLPRAALKLVQKASRSPLYNLLLRVRVLRNWTQASRALLSWPEDVALFSEYKTFRLISSLYDRTASVFRFINSFNIVLDISTLIVPFHRYGVLARVDYVHRLAKGIQFIHHPVLDLTGIKAKQREQERLYKGIRRTELVKELYSRLSLPYNPPPSPEFDSKYLDLLWLRDVLDRLDAIRRSVDSFEQALTVTARLNGRVGNNSTMVHNLVIDGTQLAIRCALTPGLDALKDSHGRPTGAITGFLQSLSSLKKRYRTADIYVTWDGSSQRRKKMFGDYKKSRSGRNPLATFEVAQLRAILPNLGIHQAFHPNEEADDAIATLVRGVLKGRLNFFVSTDRDLLQLVTLTDHQLVPAVGAGKEKLYTVEVVTQEYGVPPELITAVRALTGDTSDDIPGPGGFGLKTAGRLVKMYGGLEALLSSNLAALTKAQYTNLRASEKQVRLNLELLQLVDNLDLTLVGPDPDQTAASHRLRELDIKMDPILAVFLPSSGAQVLHA